MHWLLLAGFIAAHFLIYLAALRHLPGFARESMIAAYHALAFVFVLAVAVAAFARGAIGFAAFCGLPALQFMYSISFLELWSLAEGSYSLQILTMLSRQASTAREEIIAACEAIGAEKKRQRLDHLRTLKLVVKSADGRLELSKIGRIIVAPLRAIVRLTTIREVN